MEDKSPTKVAQLVRIGRTLTQQRLSLQGPVDRFVHPIVARRLAGNQDSLRPLDRSKFLLDMCSTGQSKHFWVRDSCISIEHGNRLDRDVQCDLVGRRLQPAVDAAKRRGPEIC